MSDHERPVEPFSDLHVEEDGHVRATLLHDPTVESCDMAIYLDGSASMGGEYENKKEYKGFLNMLLQRPTGTLPNKVEPQARWILEYLATKDRNGELRVAYWACGNGRQIEFIGDLKGVDVEQYQFPGPMAPGNSTQLEPAIRDFVDYMRKQTMLGAKQGCAVFITDGAFCDAQNVKNFCAQLAKDIANKRVSKMNFILVGVGDQIDEEQMEDICHEEYEGVGHLWCHRIAAEIGQVAELVAVLVDETMTVAAGGTIYDDKGKVLKVYEARLPAILEFKVPKGCTSFTLEINGQRYTQPLPTEAHASSHH
jgi:hypothetical protein